MPPLLGEQPGSSGPVCPARPRLCKILSIDGGSDNLARPGLRGVRGESANAAAMRPLVADLREKVAAGSAISEPSTSCAISITRQLGDLGSDLRGEFGFGAREIIGELKAQPDRGRAAEVAGEPQRGFRRDRP